MPDASSSIGTQRDLSVRLGNTLRPQVLTLKLKSGQLSGGTLHADLFKSVADMTPLPAGSSFEVKAMEPTAAGEPRFVITLDKQKVTALATLASDLSMASGTARRRTGVRTLYWTCSYEDAAGSRYPLYYGQLLIYLGASGG